MRFGFITTFLLGFNIFAGETQFNGQFSVWGSSDSGSANDRIFGFRYMPRISSGWAPSGSGEWDVEAEINLSGAAFYESPDGWDTEGDADLYRLWLRYSSEQLEVRLGLQKINFGSATLLRPLMWFDRVDPRDPLALTDGVYGILVRRYFLNNANLWGWALYGNDDPKGWEQSPTDDGHPELGGRYQFPFGDGELGFTFHHRRVKPEPGALKFKESLWENRYALDGKWDYVVGLWLEAAVIEQDVAYMQYQRLINLGCDYTFSLGNGITAFVELFSYDTADDVFGNGEGAVLGALSANYPLGMLDTLTAMVYFDWQNDQTYRFVNWQRSYDHWSFHAMAFWNPEDYQLFEGDSEINRFSGRGFQLMAVFDH